MKNIRFYFFSLLFLIINLFSSCGSDITSIISENDVQAVYWNRSYDPYSIQRDKNLKSYLVEKGIEVKTINPIINVVKTNISLEDRTVPSSAALSNFRWEGSSVLSCELSSSAILKTFLCWRMK